MRFLIFLLLCPFFLSAQIAANTDKIQLDSTDYPDMQSLLAGGTTPYVYLDLWATWCGPCKREFTKKGKLAAFVAEHADEIELVYISVDKRKGRFETVSNAINFYGLKGKHVVAGPKLDSHLRDLFAGEGRSLSLPTYIILKRDGTVVNSDAARPSEWGKLRRQLEGAIGKD